MNNKKYRTKSSDWDLKVYTYLLKLENFNTFLHYILLLGTDVEKSYFGITGIILEYRTINWNTIRRSILHKVIYENDYAVYRLLNGIVECFLLLNEYF